MTDPKHLGTEYNGLGFIKVPLIGSTRLHVHTPLHENRRVVRHTRIHDHRFSFRSRVLYGRLYCRTYKVGTAPDGTFKLYELLPDPDAKFSPPPMRLHLIGPCNVQLLDEFEVRTNESYICHGPGEFHDIWCETDTITIVEKIRTDDNYAPRVVGPASSEPEDAYHSNHGMHTNVASECVARAFGHLSRKYSWSEPNE